MRAFTLTVTESTFDHTLCTHMDTHTLGASFLASTACPQTIICAAVQLLDLHDFIR